EQAAPAEEEFPRGPGYQYPPQQPQPPGYQYPQQPPYQGPPQQ
ncbi:MAG: hypothetical protein QOE05_843, partial [Actinomycetota bacterium]|nr:hypothetical protein [Actinomycetota bacterium]